MESAPKPSFRLPAIAVGLALAYLGAATLVPVALPVAVAAAAVGACAVVLVRRTSARLRLALLAIAVWLAVGFAGAVVLRGDPGAGLGWTLLVLFLLPLPLVPWLYARTFEEQARDVTPGSGGAG